MAPPSNFNSDQLEFFQNRYSKYRQAQAEGELTDFWESLFLDFFDLWKEEPEGKTRKDQMKYWFRNHKDSRKRGERAGQPVLNLQPLKRKRARTAEEQYSKLYYREKLKEQVDEVLEHKPKGQHAAVIKSMTREAFQNETEEVKHHVRETVMQERNKMKLQREMDKAKNPEYTPEMQAAYTVGLVDKLSNILAELEKKTGWTYSLMCGGPDPKTAGRVQVYGIHRGKNKDGKNFHEVHADAQKGYSMAFVKFLHHKHRSPTANPTGNAFPETNPIQGEATNATNVNESPQVHIAAEATSAEKVSSPPLSHIEREAQAAAVAAPSGAPAEPNLSHEVELAAVTSPLTKPWSSQEQLEAELILGASFHGEGLEGLIPQSAMGGEVYEGFGDEGFDFGGPDDIWTVVENQVAGPIYGMGANGAYPGQADPFNTTSNSFDAMLPTPFAMAGTIPSTNLHEYAITLSPQQRAAIAANVTHPSLDDDLNMLLGTLVPSLDPHVLFPNGFPPEIAALADTSTTGPDIQATTTLTSTEPAHTAAAPTSPAPIIGTPTQPIVPTITTPPKPIAPVLTNEHPAAAPPESERRPQRERKSTNRDLVTLTGGIVDPGINKPRAAKKQRRAGGRG
ncbi:hypothetical protein BDN72DRAFT_898212 [Pluteus cervinus]|uniref:Uncharacterized protein n=1 Tax=Pluteus cervinus TaxID=181527 RepID=A0ACD3ARA9_9AGAR|nr:hypothetical protein BDN72DRAFT_898212 [Pluteus cervinus]